jgi:hypothetical protein
LRIIWHIFLLDIWHIGATSFPTDHQAFKCRFDRVPLHFADLEDSPSVRSRIGQVTSSRDSSRRSREAPKIGCDADVDAPIAQRCQLLNAVHLDKENLDLRKILAECTQAARQHRGRKRRDVRATFSRPREPRAASCTR